MASFLAFLLYTSVAIAQTDPALTAGRDALERHDLPTAARFFRSLDTNTDVRTRAVGRYYLAVVDDERFVFADALAGYRAFVALDPGNRLAARALARIDDLAQHEEGGFAPLVALERVRRDPRLSESDEAIATLAREAERFPTGGVRTEARMLVGEAWLERLERPREAAEMFLRVARDPSSPATTRDLAAERLLAARLRTGEEPRAAREVATLSGITDEVRDTARVLGRRRWIYRVAWAVLAGVVAMGAAAVMRAVRRGAMRVVGRAWGRPVPIAQLVMLVGGGGFLAWKGEGHDPWPFVWLGAGVTGVYLAVVASRVVGLGPRWLRAFVAVVAVLAAAVVAMFVGDPMMLEGVGL